MRTAPLAITPSAAFAEVERLYEQGLYLQAYASTQSIGPLEQWPLEQALLGARLMAHLGAPRRADATFLRCFRQDPGNPANAYYYARAVLRRKGPLACWLFLRDRRELDTDHSVLQAHWSSFQSVLLARFRDFERAHQAREQAQQLAPEDPWVWCEAATVLEQADRYEEARDSAELAVRLQPFYRPAVQQLAHIHQLLGNDDAALDLLQQAHQRLESYVVALQLSDLLLERQRLQEAAVVLEDAEARSPLKEPELAASLAAQRSDLAYLQGDSQVACELADAAASPFYHKVAEHMAAAPADSCRKLLDVEFVRQHHMTCAPATLTALSRYWQVEVDHLELAESICYDGTPNDSERHWAEESGWVTREFTVTPESARQLIDRGVPFTLSTVEPGNAHLQAVVGYDQNRGTLLIRDPYHRRMTEFLTTGLLERHRSTGPRGLALVPGQESHRIEDLELPDEQAYDLYHGVQRLLRDHQRGRAQESAEQLQVLAPDHRLAWFARYSLASYDENTLAVLEAVEGLLAQFPDDGVLLLCKLRCLREIGRREERLQIYDSICARPDCPPIFWQQYAQEIAHEQPEKARRLLHRVIRAGEDPSGTLFILAHQLWRERRFAEALELYRLALCGDDKNESFAQAYFSASRHLERSEEALDLLRRRFDVYGGQSGQPARSLYWALDQLEQTEAGLEMLEQALQRRPRDGELLLFGAEVYSRIGELDRGEGLLQQAEPYAQKTTWLRAAASLHQFREQRAEALQCWRQVLEREPLAADAHSAVAHLVAETEGPAQALQVLQEAVERWPHAFALCQLLVEWQSEEDPEAAAQALEKLLTLNPTDAWARRERAVMLIRLRRYDEAEVELEGARKLDPQHVSYFNVLADLQSLTGRLEEARETFRHAVRLDVDSPFALHGLVRHSKDAGQRREALAFIWEQLHEQVVFGNGLTEYFRLARSLHPPEEILQQARHLCTVKPELWQTWSGLLRQLISSNLLDEALEVGQEAVQRFPLVPRIHLDFAKVYLAREQYEQQAEALDQALRIHPDSLEAFHELATCRERGHQMDAAEKVLRQGLRRLPRCASLYVHLAEILQKRGITQDSHRQLLSAIDVDPTCDEAWSALRNQAAEDRELQEQILQRARQGTERAPGSLQSWLTLARVQADAQPVEERFEALERAIALEPRNLQAHEEKAEQLAELGRFDQALAACDVAELFEGCVPTTLRAQAARIEALRGDLQKAVKWMRQLLEEEPAFYGGWAYLADWQEELGDLSGALAAAEQMAQLRPQHPPSLGYLGHARWQLQDREGAREAFERAFARAPDYLFAGRCLFQLCLEDRDYTAARAVVEILETHSQDPFLQSLRVRWHLAQKQRREACKILASLSLSRGSGVDAAVSDVVRELLTAGQRKQAVKTLKKLLKEPEATPAATYWWFRLVSLHQGFATVRARLRQLAPQGDRGRQALIACLETSGECGRVRATLTLTRKWRDLLQQDSTTWIKAVDALRKVAQTSAARRFLGDWQARDLQPWMLVAVARALLCCQPRQTALEALHKAEALPPDHSSGDLRLWKALLQSLDGPDPAGQRDLPVASSEASAEETFLSSLLAALQVAEQGDSTKPQWRRDCKRHLRCARRALPGFYREPDLSLVYRRTLRMVSGAGRAGSTFEQWGEWLWWCLCDRLARMLRS